jgi:serine/threonine protein kinase
MAKSDKRERYEFRRFLGQGGTAAVSLVYDSFRQEEVAEKRPLLTTAEAVLRFKREFRVIEQLSHPGLVRLYELGEDSEGLYFTMEHVPGLDLFTYCWGGLGGFEAGTRTSPTVPSPGASGRGSGNEAGEGKRRHDVS